MRRKPNREHLDVGEHDQVAIDVFSSLLREEAKRFLELGSGCADVAGQSAYFHAAVILGFNALECHLAAITDDIESTATLSAHERALLTQRDVRLADGEFVVTDSLKMVPLEDRIQLMHWHFSGDALDRTWWSELKSAIKLRNELTRPKGPIAIPRASVERAVQAILDTIDAMCRAVCRTSFPAASCRLQSKLNF